MDPKNISADAVLTLKETAEALGMDPKRVRRAIQTEGLKASRIGVRTWRIIWADAQAWLRRHQYKPPAHVRRRVEEMMERDRKRRGAR